MYTQRFFIALFNVTETINEPSFRPVSSYIMALLLKPEKSPEVISFAAVAMNTILKKITMVFQNFKVQIF